LTFYVMGPTYQQVYDTALRPYLAKEDPIGFDEALRRAESPVRDFMLKNTYESDLRLFTKIRGERPKSRSEVKMASLIPAFVISELKTAFVVGFFVFIPFVMIDLIVASVLMGMGMMMMPPTVVSLPIKLLVFVLANGWHVLVQAILAGSS
jgi:flagellar biosynthetic protein FliP